MFIRGQSASADNHPGSHPARAQLELQPNGRGKATAAGRRAVAAVELAVLLPFLAFLLLVTIDFARVFYYAITIENCLHNGVMFGSQTFDNQNQQWLGNNQFWQGPNGQIVSQGQAASQLDGMNLSPALSSSNITVTNGTDADGNPVNIVTISYPFQTITQFPGIPSQLTIQRSAQMRVAPAVP
jgi:Flp pilus assembly protein TadG